MTRTILAALLACLFLAPRAGRCGDLNAPGGKVVTVGTEIVRGYEAADGCHIEEGYDYYADALRKVKADNKQRNTDTDGFRLGMALGEWLNEWLLLRNGGLKPDEAKDVSSAAAMSFMLFKSQEKQLGLTDEDLRKCPGVVYFGRADDEKWEAASKNRTFAGSR